MDVEFLRRRLGLVPNGSGGASLALLRERLARAEAELEAARAAMRSAADVAGIKRSGLFSDTAFVPRSTADKWHADGRREGEKTIINILSRSIDADSADENSPFRHLAKRLKKIQPGDWPEHVAKMRAVMDSAGPRWERMRAAGYFEAIEAEDYDKAAAIYREVNPELFAQSKGAAILAAGARRRMSGDAAGEVPEPGGLAKKIIDSGRRRRGEIQ